jgi:coatomer subunit beta'
MEWIVIGTSDGFIHAYAYGTRKAEKITSFQASTSTVTLLAIHPTLPYVLSAAKNGEMKLWSWDVVEDSDWDCAQTYEVEHTDDICQLTFNPKDTKTFVSASGDHTVKVRYMYVLSPAGPFSLSLSFVISSKGSHGVHDAKTNRIYMIELHGVHQVWSLDSTKSNYTLFGHSSAVTCLDFFTRDDTQYLLSGSKDATVKVSMT